MIDIIDPSLRTSRSYKNELPGRIRKPLRVVGWMIVFLILCFFIYLIGGSFLDTKPQDNIEINPDLKTVPGQNSTTGRVPVIPTTPDR